MSSMPRRGAVCRHASWIGVVLVHFALLLHPMDPLEFLSLQASAPLASLVAPFGTGATMLFWFGTIVAAAGMVGLARRALKPPATAKRRNATALQSHA